MEKNKLPKAYEYTLYLKVDEKNYRYISELNDVINKIIHSDSDDITLNYKCDKIWE